MTDATQPKRRMTDTELIAFLREHLWGVTEAIFRVVDVVNETGTRREGPYERIKIIMPYALAELIEYPKPDSKLGLLYRALDVYMKEHDATGPLRSNAFAALGEALTMDFTQALQASPGANEEMLRYWLEESPETLPPAPEGRTVAVVVEKLNEEEARVAVARWRSIPDTSPTPVPTVRHIRMLNDRSGLYFNDALTGERIDNAFGYRHPDYMAGRDLPTTPGRLLLMDDETGADAEVPAFLVEAVWRA